MKRNTDRAFLQCEQATDACLELMRADIRARHPRASRARVAREMERRLSRLRRAKLAAYGDNA